MVFSVVPPQKGQKKLTPRENFVGLLVAGGIALGFAIVVVLKGPKSGNPPPPIVLWVLLLLAAVFGVVAFFAWLHGQSEPDAPSQDQDSEEEK